MNNAQKIQSMVKELNEYRDSYYNDNFPAVSDEVYDRMFDELKRLEQETGVIMSNSPTQSVGYEVKSKLDKVKHKIPLLSLDKTKSVDDLVKFIGNKKSIIMAKADGLTVKLEYKDGRLFRASTRGDSMVGEDITHNVSFFKNVPLQIAVEEPITIVGEAIILNEDFEKINSTLPEDKKYKNPRNLTSGSVRQLDSRICEEREVNFFAFGIIDSGMELPDSKVRQFKMLNDLGFSNIPHSYHPYTKEDIERAILSIKEICKKDGIGIDGMVISYDSTEYSDSLGVTSHHPLHSIAFKFDDEVAKTKFKSIEWSMGKTGVLTPVGIFEPVEIDGTMVSRASIHNLSILKGLMLGEGDEIGVIKANMIIPQIVDNYTHSDKFEIPEYCPFCGEQLVVEQENNTEVLLCPDKYCKERITKEIAVAVSRKGLNVEGLSESTIRKFVKKRIIDDILSIYTQIEDKDIKDIILSMDGFGDKSYKKLIDAIEKSRNTNFYRFLYALNIPLIGQSASKQIAKYVNFSFGRFSELMDNNFDFTQLEDFGETMNNSIYAWWSELDNKNLFYILSKELNFTDLDELESKQSNDYKDLSGMTFCVTGTFENFKPRKKLEELIADCGGKISGSVSAKTSMLITNDTESGSKKNKNAQRYGVRIINEIDFMDYVGYKV